MGSYANPFEYEAASTLDTERLTSWFIDDHNYARFIKSKRNIILDGDRGSGKSMILVYYALGSELAKAKAQGHALDLKNLGVYVPCNNPLLQRGEHAQGLEGAERSIISERYLTYTILASLAKSLSLISDQFEQDEKDELLEELQYLLPNESLSEITDPFVYLRRHVHSCLRQDQDALGAGLKFEFSFETSTFYIHILPFLEALRRTRPLRETHFSLLIDDAHMLDNHQKQIVNSWLGYRDHSLFSLKVAIAGLRNYELTTTFGGVILDGHDYTAVDLYRPFQNLDSQYGRFALKVVQRRLDQAGIKISAKDYFPVSPSFVKDLEKSKAKAEKVAEARGISRDNRKAFNDFRYKFGRAFYFRDRSSKANKPQYSGFETISHLSTGVVRTLLNLCYRMYEHEFSLNGKSPKLIRSDIQRQIILEVSDKQWEFIRNDIEKSVPNCSPEDAGKIESLFRRLSEYFRDRLLAHNSEPRVLVFSISGFNRDHHSDLAHLLDIAEEAQLLYVRSGTEKKGGGRENYYVLNRLLFPQYGLDVQGQHGRASLKANDLLAAAAMNKPLPKASEEDPPINQGELFDV